MGKTGRTEGHGRSGFGPGAAEGARGSDGPSGGYLSDLVHGRYRIFLVVLVAGAIGLVVWFGSAFPHLASGGTGIGAVVVALLLAAWLIAAIGVHLLSVLVRGLWAVWRTGCVVAVAACVACELFLLFAGVLPIVLSLFVPYVVAAAVCLVAPSA